MTAADLDGLARLREKREQLQRRRYSENTRATYATGWRTFREWCDEHGLTSLPATSETLELFAAHLALLGASPNTITTKIAAIRTVHQTPEIVGLAPREGGWPIPDGTKASGLADAHRRDLVENHGWQEKQADPVTVEHLKMLRESIKGRTPQRLIDVRDWSIIMLGFALGSRRSMMAGLNIEHIGYDPPHWLTVLIAFSKTDQSGIGRMVQVKRGKDHTLCPVQATLDYIACLKMRGVDSGPLYRAMQRQGTKLTIHGEARSPKALAGGLTPKAHDRVLKRRVAEAQARGYPVDLKIVSWHGQRRGAGTATYEAGASVVEIADQFGWSRQSASLWRYIEQVDQRRRNAMARVL